MITMCNMHNLASGATNMSGCIATDMSSVQECETPDVWSVLG